MRLQIQIILKNDSNSVLDCIQSLSAVKNKRIILADIGLCDLKPFQTLNVEIVKYKLDNSFAKIRNQMIEKCKEPWILWLESNETLIQGADEINEIITTDLIDSFNCKIIENSTIFKDIKLFHKDKKIKFKFPIFEVLNDSTKLTTKIFFNRTSSKTGIEDKLLKSWKTAEPLAPEPLYYEALLCLSNSNFPEFIRHCESYFFLDSTSDSALLLRYYLAQIQALKLKEYKKALSNILFCLEKQPLFAEFWCLLGDIYWKLRSYSRAMAFYENATILGSKRTDDDLPVEVNKYKEYPTKMANRCQELIDTLLPYEVKHE